ncbi:MAG: HD domain-containing protein, partial [Thermodesulfobacteriota bacterium]|nr:HD domain-containing protein [Thermodesulfobacteriota bacterium]
CNILQSVLPELLEGYGRRQNTCHQYTIFRHILETVDRVMPVPLLRLTGLFHDIAKPRVRKKMDGTWRFHGHEKASAVLAMEIMGRLRFSKEMIEKVTNLVRHHMIAYDSEWSDAAVRRLISRVGLEQIMDLIALRRADIQAHGLKHDKLDHLSELEARVKVHITGQIAIKPNDLAIDGHKVMEVLGIPPGPEVGRVLDELVERIIDYPELNDEDRLLGLLKQMKGA